MRKTRIVAAFRRQNAGNCVLIVERFAVMGESFAAMDVKSGKTVAKQVLTFASTGRTAVTEHRNKSCARTGARSDPIDVKFLVIVENSDRIIAICAATGAISGATAGTLDTKKPRGKGTKGKRGMGHGN
ncbi:MAG TPA: hypothetical protein VGO56_00975 [Pyrinomonadaceae bacterium]|nr:hypothetical protein [Pyrinomonadaceae bacterium]